MWQDDKLWLPHVLAGKKVEATFTFDEHEQMLPDGTKLEIVEEIV